MRFHSLSRCKSLLVITLAFVEMPRETTLTSDIGLPTITTSSTSIHVDLIPLLLSTHLKLQRGAKGESRGQTSFSLAKHRSPTSIMPTRTRTTQQQNQRTILSPEVLPASPARRERSKRSRDELVEHERQVSPSLSKVCEFFQFLMNHR